MPCSAAASPPPRPGPEQFLLSHLRRAAPFSPPFPLVHRRTCLERIQDFTASRLSFEVTGEGVAIDPATGHLSLDTDGLRTGIVVTVTATNALGGTVSRMRLTLATDADTAPVLVAGPVLAGAAGGKAVVGTPVSLDPGTWDGVPVPDLAVAWLLDGVGVAGAVGTSYTPAAADEGKSLSARVTAANAAGAACGRDRGARDRPCRADSGGAARRRRRSTPVPRPSRSAAAAFAGAALTFAVSGRGAVIDSATGLVTIATEELLDGERITVTATNSGGSAQASFTATVRATLPVAHRQPVLAVASAGAKGLVGTALAVDPGDWSGVPVPGLAFAWLRGGAVIVGATGTSYTPVPGRRRQEPLGPGDGDEPRRRRPRPRPRRLRSPTPSPTVVAPLADVGLVVGGNGRSSSRRRRPSPAARSSSRSRAAAPPSTPEGRVRRAGDGRRQRDGDGDRDELRGQREGLLQGDGVARDSAPGPPVAPVLAGSGRIGTPVTTTTGNWSGAPATVVEWLVGGVAVAGATGTSYAPLPGPRRQDAVGADQGDERRRQRHDGDRRARGDLRAAGGQGRAPRGDCRPRRQHPDRGGGRRLHRREPRLRGHRRRGDDRREDRRRLDPDRRGGTGDGDGDGDELGRQRQLELPGDRRGGRRIPFALEADDTRSRRRIWRPGTQETWFTPVVRFPGLAGETVHAIEWTTSTKTPIPETEYEVVTKVGTEQLPALHARLGEEHARCGPARRLQRLHVGRELGARRCASAGGVRPRALGRQCHRRSAFRPSSPRRSLRGYRPRPEPRKPSRPKSSAPRASSTSAAALGTSVSSMRRSAAGC